MSTAGTKRKVEGGPDVVLLDLHLPSDGHTCRAPDTPGADVIERAGKLYLRLDPALLQQYDSHPPAEVRNKAWGGTCEEIIQRRKREFAKEGAVHGLQDLLLRACPEAAAVARRADLVAPLRGEQWGPGGDLKVTWAWERYRAVNEWMDTQLGTYEAHDQRQPERLKARWLGPLGGCLSSGLLGCGCAERGADACRAASCCHTSWPACASCWTARPPTSGMTCGPR